MRDIEELLKESARRTEQYLRDICKREPSDLLRIFEAEEYSLMGGGKRIRPFLVFEFCRALGGDEKVAAPFACAIEMIHTYSLIHDDLPCMDDDTYRRGRLTCHKQFDEATAVLAGDALLTGAFGVAASNKALSAEQCLEAIRVLSEAAGDCGMIGGQILDMQAETKGVEGLDGVIRLHGLKTGALIRASAVLGCIAAGAKRGDVAWKAAEKYAEGIGLAFQIVDDLLDVRGDAERMGKATGMDAKMNKVTFMNYKTQEEAETFAEALTMGAIGALEDMENGETLRALAHYLLARNY